MKRTAAFARPEKAIAGLAVVAVLFAALFCVFLPQIAQAQYGVPDTKPCGSSAATSSEAQAPCPGTMYLEVFDEPSCTSEGIGEYYCDTCDYSEGPVTLPKLPHSYSETSRTSPTCTEKGSIEMVCVNCGAETTKSISATGHTWGSWVTEKEATEKAAGLKTRSCEVCGTVQSKEIPQLKPVKKDEEEAADGTGDVVEEKKAEKKDKPEKKKKLVEDAEEESDSGVVPVEDDDSDSGSPLKTAGVVVIAVAALAAVYFLIAKPLIAGGAAAAGAAAAAATETAGVAAAASTEAAAAAAGGKFLFSPNSNPKTVLICTGEAARNQALIENMQAKSYLVVKSIEPASADSVAEATMQIRPDLIVLHLDGPDGLEALKADMDVVSAAYGRKPFGIVADDCVEGSQDEARAALLTEKLDALQEAGEIVSYVFESACDDDKLLRLVLPVYGPRAKANEALDAVALVASAMGVPLVAGIINAVQNGGEIQQILDRHNANANDALTIFADITEIMGFNVLGYAAQSLDDSTRAAKKSDAEVGTGGARTKVKVLADLVYVLGSLT